MEKLPKDCQRFGPGFPKTWERYLNGRKSPFKDAGLFPRLRSEEAWFLRRFFLELYKSGTIIMYPKTMEISEDKFVHFATIFSCKQQKLATKIIRKKIKYFEFPSIKFKRKRQRLIP
jgi:hypothetical protein